MKNVQGSWGPSFKTETYTFTYESGTVYTLVNETFMTVNSKVCLQHLLTIYL